MVRVKVCGLRSVAETLACAAAGADWVGLNFHPRSPRFVDPDLAAVIVRALPARCEAVGLFVDRPPVEVLAMARRVGLRTVQLHGNEPPEDFLLLEDLRVVRAYRIADAASLARMVADLARADTLGRAPDAVLVDAFVAGQDGGTGHSIPAGLLALLPGHPRLILAGGLTPENVAERVALVRPWMVDVASGVEKTPGEKDPARVAAFIDAVRSTPRAV